MFSIGDMGLTSLNVQPRSLELEKFARTFGRRSKMIQSDENGLEVLDNVMRFIFLIDDFIVVPMEENCIYVEQKFS